MPEEPTPTEPSPRDDSEVEFRPAPLPSEAPEKSLTQMARDFVKKPPDQPIQFSLGEFMIWIGIVSVGLSGLTWIQPQVLAGISGAMAVILLIFCPIDRPQSRSQLFFTAFLAMYAIALFITFVRLVR